jgi:enoyl-CoA hydratase/carnithine racemase
MSGSEAHVAVGRAGGIVTIALDRPEKRNALTGPMLEALDQAVQDAAADAEVRVVVVQGNGPDFCAGFDLGTVRADELAEERLVREREHLFERALRIRNLPMPTIAVVQGGCIAAGLLISQMCDLVVASDDASFYNPLPRMGGVGLEVLVEPWDMGVRKAKRYLFTGERIPAAVALELGMVTDVVEREVLHERAAELAERIAAMPPVTLSLIKRSLNRTQELMGLRESLEYHFAVHQLGHATQESRALLHEARQGRPLKDYFNRRDEGKL